MELHALADDGRELARECRVADAEMPDFRRHAGDDVECELALVGLADPALARELLQQSRTLALGVVPRQGDPCV